MSPRRARAAWSRRLGIVLLVLLVPALQADTLTLTQPVLEAMTPIDGLPSVAALDAVFGANQAEANLQLIALTTDPTVDFGVQLRAIRTLPAYCPASASCAGQIAHDTLVTLLVAYRSIPLPTPRDLLRLRAAIEALGVAGVSAGLDSDQKLLAGFLDHTSRDVRATTAKALGTLCNTNASTALRLRAVAEPSQQVVLAISAALRDLVNCPGGT